jgi:hypothetical protein
VYLAVVLFRIILAILVGILLDNLTALSALVIEAGNNRDDDELVKYATGYLAISTSAVSTLFVIFMCFREGSLKHLIRDRNIHSITIPRK